MNTSLAAIAGLTAAAMMLPGLAFFGARKPGYSHIRHTISELGETGARDQRSVNFLWFLPNGLLVMLFALGAAQWFAALHDGAVAAAMLAGVGAGYVLSAAFPCDPGAPLVGTWRNGIHNLGAVLAYGGALGALMTLARSFEDAPAWQAWAQPTQTAGFVVLGSIAGLTLLWPIRGLAQRVGEAAIFGWIAAVSAVMLAGQNGA